MFGVKKNTEDRREPSFESEDMENNSSEYKNLASILGAEENDTNITASVDAVLDEVDELGTDRFDLRQDSITVPTYSSDNVNNYVDETYYQEETDENDEYEYVYEYVEDTSASETLENLEEEYVYVDDNDDEFALDAQEDEYVYVEDDVLENDSATLNNELNYAESDVVPAEMSEEYENTSDNNGSISNYYEMTTDEVIQYDVTTETSEETVNYSENSDVVSQPEVVVNSVDLDAMSDREIDLDDLLDNEDIITNIDEISDISNESDVIDTQESDSFTVNDGVANIDPVNEVSNDVLIDDIAVVCNSTNDNMETDLSADQSYNHINLLKEMVVESSMGETHFVEYEKNENRVISDNCLESSLYTIKDGFNDVDNFKVINKYSAVGDWQADKYQKDIRLELGELSDINNWSLYVMNRFSAPLQADKNEIVVDKNENTIRYASLMKNGEEKLKIFNQTIYKFAVPQNDMYTVQGNVICGNIDNTCSLDILDFVCISLEDKVGKTITFNSPVFGFIIGPNGVRIHFADLQSFSVLVNNKVEENVFEYIPSLKGLDGKSFFVYDATQGSKEFVAQGKQKVLVVNVGTSLYGWNVRFDNEMYMSLRDAVEYQSRYKKLPSANGEVINGSNVLRFFGIEKLRVREKTVYYSYGKI